MLFLNPTSIDLAGCTAITDVALAALAATARSPGRRQPLVLAALNLAGCTEITNEGLKKLGRAGFRFKHLNLSGCSGVNDEGVSHLDLTCIQTIDLTRTQITDASLARIQLLPSLRSIGILGCGQVSPAGVSALKQALQGRVVPPHHALEEDAEEWAVAWDIQDAGDDAEEFTMVALMLMVMRLMLLWAKGAGAPGNGDVLAVDEDEMVIDEQDNDAEEGDSNSWNEDSATQEI